MGPSQVNLQAAGLNVVFQSQPSLFSRISSGANNSQDASNRILNNISLNISGPSLTAVIGPSGSGKTTLLNALSNNLKRQGRNLSKTAGYVAADSEGQQLTSADIAYVRQSDTLFASLTVRETLEYAAALSRSTSTSRDERVDKIIRALRLGGCANNRIGDKSHKGCSGGEIRRTSIGVQILKDQRILFLDEPTTGLDPKAALEVVQVLRDLANYGGKTVVMTLHQPRSEIWWLLDNLVAMSQASVLFAGTASEAMRHFAEAGWRAPRLENPFDFLSDLIAIDGRSPKVEAASQARIEILKSLWKGRCCNSGAMPPSTSPQKETTRRQQASEFFRQLRIHSRRVLLLTLRDRLGILASFLEALCMGLSCGLIFYRLDTSLTGIKSREGALYCTSSMQSYLILLSEIYRLTIDLPIYHHERADGVITPITFYLSRRLTRFFLEDVPVPLIFSLSFYFMAGMRTGISHFFSYFLIQFLLHLISVNLAICCVVPTREFMIAGLLANLNYVVQCFCAGLFINPKSMGDWIGWVIWVTQLHYGLSAMYSNEFAGRTFDCPVSGAEAGSQCQQYTGAFVMDSLGLPEHWFAVPVVALGGFIALFALTAIAALHWTPAPTSKTSEPKQSGGSMQESQPLMTVKTPVNVSLDNLSIQIRIRNLLSRTTAGPLIGPVSASFQPGTLNAILGPSGCGKTSLLNAVAHRLGRSSSTTYSQSGSISFNGYPVTTKTLASVCSFVEQHDFDGQHQLTVRETLRYAARLRLPAHLSSEQKAQRGDAVLLEMGLQGCADKIVGNTHLRGISGGEKRRLSIAVQMLSNPSVLLLDEPTSGLDAFTASTIVEVLQKLANEGRTIIMVVHQPRWKLMQACAKVMMLSCDRRMAFLGTPDDLVQHFAATKHSYEMSAANPADIALDMLADGLSFPSRADVNSERVISSTSSSASFRSSHKSSERINIVPVAPLPLEKQAKPPFPQVLLVLMQRTIANLRRAPILLLGRIAQIAGTGIIVVLFFTPLHHDQPSTQTRMGLIGQSSALFFVGMLNALALYPAELDLFLHEFRDGVYGPEAFFASYTLIELPIETISALLLSLLMVFATGLSERPDVYLLISYTSFAIVNCGESLGMTFLSYIRHSGLAISIMSVILALCTALNGAFSLNMPAWLSGLNCLSPAKWQIQASASMSLRGVAFSCTHDECLVNGRCPIETGEQLLKLYNLDVSTTKAACILAAVVVGYRLMAYVALKVRCRLSR